MELHVAYATYLFIIFHNEFYQLVLCAAIQPYHQFLFCFAEEGMSPVDKLVPVCNYPVRENCRSICKTGLSIFIGTRGYTDRLQCITQRLPDNRIAYPPSKSFENMTPTICCVRVYRGLLYALYQLQNAYWIFQYRLPQGGKLTQKMEVYCGTDSDKANQFDIYRSKIYMPKRSHNTIMKYHLSEEDVGNKIQIQLSDSPTCVAATPRGHLLISQSSPSLLVCIDLETENELWRFNDLNQPQGITADSYLNHFLVYTAPSDPMTGLIEVRDILTGEPLC